MLSGEIMRIERKKRGWSQSQLAKKLHVSRVTISRYERGLSSINLDMVTMISKVFQCSFLDYLNPNEEKIDCKKEMLFINLLRKEKKVYKQVLDFPEKFIEIIKRYC